MASVLDLGNLLIRISADATGLYSTVSRVDTTLDRTAANMERAGARMTAALTVPLVMVGKSVAKTIIEFDQGMTKALSITEGAGEGIRHQMEQTAKAISNDSIHKPEELATAYFHLAQAGLTAEQSMASLQPVANFATAAMVDLERATELLVQSQAALGLSSADPQKQLQNLERVSNVLSKAANLTTASQESLGAALQNKAASAARILGKDVEETVAVLSTFAKVGVHAETAGERLDILWRDLGQAISRQPDEWSKLGLSVYDAAGNFRNTADVLEDINRVMKPLTDQQKTLTLATLGFQYRSVSALKQLLGLHGEMRSYEQQLRSVGDETERLADEQMGSMQSKLQQLMARFSNAKLLLERDFAAALEYVVQKGNDLLQWWQQLDPTTRRWIAVAGAITAATGPVLLIFGSLAAATSSLIAVVGGLAIALAPIAAPLAVIAGFGAAATGLYQMGKALFSLTSEARRLNEEVERSKALTNGMISQRTLAQDKRFTAITSIADPTQRRSALTNELSTASAQAKGLKRAEELDSTTIGAKEASAYVDKLTAALKQTEAEVQSVEAATKKAFGEDLENRFHAIQAASEKATDAITSVGDDIVLLEFKLKGIPDELAKGMQQIAELQKAGAGEDQLRQLDDLIQRRFELNKQLEDQTRLEDEIANNFKMLEQDGKQLFADLMTPMEKFKNELNKLETLLDAGVISRETFERGVGRAGKTAQSELENDSGVSPRKGDQNFRSDIKFVDETQETALKLRSGVAQGATPEDKMEKHLAEIKNMQKQSLDLQKKQVPIGAARKVMNPMQIKRFGG